MFYGAVEVGEEVAWLSLLSSRILLHYFFLAIHMHGGIRYSYTIMSKQTGLIITMPT